MDPPKTSASKRPLPAESMDDNPEPSTEKRVRFPKGKKVKKSNAFGVPEEAFGSWMNPDIAAKERTKRRSRNREMEVLGDQDNGALKEILSHSEVNYGDNASFDDDGIRIEPFNLTQEKEEGYFDDQGNFVEYVNKDIKDAWLDSVDTVPRYAETKAEKAAKEVEQEYQDLSPEDIGKIKRSIADILNPGETVIQALKRLKGTTSGKKDKMSEDTKRLFDLLTENAMKLMENGEYNVYHEKQETFEREAEGYERVARAKSGTSFEHQKHSQVNTASKDLGTSDNNPSVPEMTVGASESKTSVQTSADDGPMFDMFGDDDEDNVTNTGPSTKLDAESASVGTESDYVYDDSSGYYYSSSTGYYYDPGSGLYCCATSGKWYSYNEESGAYDEVQDNSAMAS